MRLLAVVVALSCPIAAHAQELTGADRAAVLEAARARYYNLTGLGLKGFTCMVNFDLATISKGMLPETDTVDRALLKAANFTLTVAPKGPTIRYKFPDGAVSQSQDVVAGVTLWITEIVHGFFQTWPSIGLHGPVPPDKQVEKLEREGAGYRLTVKDSGSAREVHLDKTFLIKEIVTRNRESEIDEHPVFAASPDGLVFRGDEIQNKAAEGLTNVRYSFEESAVNGMLLPSAVHLIVGDHMDVRFGLSGCGVDIKKR